MLLLASSAASVAGSDCFIPDLPDRPMAPAPELVGSARLLRDVVYDHQEGIDLLMDLLLPVRADGQAVPVLFYPSAGGHGIPNTPFCEAVQARGYAIARASVRYFEEDSKYPDALVDAKSAVRFLKTNADEYGIDPERIVACGSSKNGMFASMLGTMGEATDYDLGLHLDVTSDVAAVINLAGHTDLTAFYADGMDDPLVRMDAQTYETKNQQFLGCPAFDCDELERAASAITYVDPTDPPQFLVLGSDDPLVPLAQMTRFRDRLFASCVPAYLLLVEDAPHGVVRVLSDGEIQRLLAFLEMFVE